MKPFLVKERKGFIIREDLAVSKGKAFLLLVVILSLPITGCGLGVPPQKPSIPTPADVPHQITPASSAESADVTAVVHSVVQAFLSNDFATAQKRMLLLPAEQADPKTQRMFTDFSLHLNKRLLLESKDAGLKAPTPSLSVANIRAAATSGKLADVSIRAANGLAPLTLTVKATQVSGVWLVDFAPFMLALMDALDEE
jgi:hypothetical protein